MGNELLSGRTVDTNSAWLSRELARLGLPVVARATVGDRTADIQEAVSRFAGATEVVLVTGGLGPTHDDRTLEAVAALFGRLLEEDASLRAALERRFRERGFTELPPSNLKMARVPRGAEVLGNPVGTAPALALIERGSTIVLLPGVPYELESIFRSLLRPYLEGRFAGRLAPVHHREIHTTGVPESELARRLEDALQARPERVEVAFLPSWGGVTLRLTASGKADEVQTLIDRTEQLMAPHLAAIRFASESGDLVEAVGRALAARRLTVATAESCTGGLLAKRLTDRAGASSFFVGGVVAYSNEAKVRTLGVREDVLRAHGAVSEEVATAMAQGAAERFGGQVGIGITGVAGPGGGSPEKPVGTVCYAVWLDGEAEARIQRFSGDRGLVRERSAQAALDLLLRRLDSGR